MLCGCGSDADYYTKKEIAEEEAKKEQEERLSEAQAKATYADTEAESQTEWQMPEIATLSEDDYKSICSEKWYDDIFFGKEDLEYDNVKLHLMLSQKYYFTSEDMAYNDTVKWLIDHHNVYTDFYKCCVKRQDAESYVGQSIDVFFSQDNPFNPSDYSVGQKYVMYGKIIHYNSNTYSGYNTVYFIPRYIESES